MGERYITVNNRVYGKDANTLTGLSKGIEYLGEKMKELSQINAELKNRIIGIITEGNECDDNKEFKAAIDNYDKAYDILPEPKFEWEMLSAWLAGSYFNAYFALGNFAEAKHWAGIELKYRSSDIDVGPFIDIGMASYELGQLDEAYENFNAAYIYGKERSFKEYPKKYLNFYLERKI